MATAYPPRTLNSPAASWQKRRVTIARRLLISGRVQGVGYRDWAVDRARGLGLSGWVRNLDDGGVELLAEGEADAVDAMIAACRVGSPGADVTDIAVTDAAPTGAGFHRKDG